MGHQRKEQLKFNHDTHIYIHTCANMSYIYTHVHICKYTWAPKEQIKSNHNIDIYIHIYIYTYESTNTYIYIYIHKYTWAPKKGADQIQ